MNSDIALEVLIRADIDTLRKVSLIPNFWCHLRLLLSASQFWYRRACYITGDRELVSQSQESDPVQSWCRTCMELEVCLDATDPLSSAVQTKYSLLTIRVLLELGFSPLTGLGATIEYAAREHPEALLAIMPSLNEEGTQFAWPLVVRAFKSRVESITLNKLDILLRVGLCDKLSPEDKPLIATRLSQRASTLTDAIREGLLEVVKHCLQLPSVKPYGFNLRDAVSDGHIAITQLLLEDGRIDPGGDSFKLVELLGQKPIEMLRLFQKDGCLNLSYLSIAVGEAACCGNLSVFRELLPLSNEHCPANLLHELTTQVHDLVVADSVSYYDRFSLLKPEVRSSIVTALLTSSPGLANSFSESTIGIIRPSIGRRVVGAYRANSNPVARGSKTLYTAFVRTLILKSLTPTEALDWLSIQNENTRVIATAAASLVSDVEPQTQVSMAALGAHATKTEEAFRGYFLSVVYGYDVERVKQRLREEGCSKDGIKLALRLVGAQLGVDEEPVPREYRVAFQTVFGF